MLLLCVFVQDHCKVEGLPPPMDVKGLSNNLFESVQSVLVPLSIAVTVSQFLVMEVLWFTTESAFLKKG